MKKYCKKIIVFLMIYMCAFIFDPGFVACAAANHVSLSMNENDGVYEVSIYLKEDVQINAFQLKLQYDREYLQSDYADFTEEFVSSYNNKKNALLKCSKKDNGTKNSILFLGVQTDDNAASQKSGTVIGTVKFTTNLTDVAEIAKELNSVVLNVEVLQGKDGNIVTNDNCWSIHIDSSASIGGTQENNQIVDEADLREDNYNSDTVLPEYTDKNSISDDSYTADSNKSSNAYTDSDVSNKNEVGSSVEDKNEKENMADSGSTVDNASENIDGEEEKNISGDDNGSGSNSSSVKENNVYEDVTGENDEASSDTIKQKEKKETGQKKIIIITTIAVLAVIIILILLKIKWSSLTRNS